MAEYYDDNFGHWDDMEDPDMVDFYHRTQRESRPTVCQGCGETFNLRPGYGYCNSCADMRERGFDV